MQSTETLDDFQQQVLTRLERLSVDVGQVRTEVEGLKHDVEGLKHDVEGLKHDVEGLKHDVEGLKQEQSLTNTRVDAYQRASNQVVNLAFGLIATATVTILVTSVVK